MTYEEFKRWTDSKKVTIIDYDTKTNVVSFSYGGKSGSVDFQEFLNRVCSGNLYVSNPSKIQDAFSAKTSVRGVKSFVNSNGVDIQKSFRSSYDAILQKYGYHISEEYSRQFGCLCYSKYISAGGSEDRYRTEDYLLCIGFSNDGRCNIVLIDAIRTNNGDSNEELLKRVGVDKHGVTNVLKEAVFLSEQALSNVYNF